MTTTQVEQDNVAAVRRGYEAFANADFATLTELFHPDATWHSPPTGVLGDTRTGRDDIFAMFATLGQETQGNFSAVPTTFAASGDEVYVRTTATGTRNGITLESDEILVFTLEDGKVRDVRLFIYDYLANQAFWS